jgi:hypothetical protein
VFGAGTANDVRPSCGAGSFAIDDVISPVDPITTGVALSLAVISSACEEDGPVSPWLNDNAEPAVKGLGLGTGTANRDAEGATLRRVVCCAG